MAVAERSSRAMFLLFMIFFPFVVCERYGAPSRTLHLYQDNSDSRQKRQIQVIDASSSNFLEDDIHGDLEEIESAGRISLSLRRKRSPLPSTNITTKATRLNDTHQQLMVHWAGEGSDVIVCLARDPAPSPGATEAQPSAVFFSYDYGETFVNKTASFQLGGPGSQYATLEKFYSHPKFNTHTVFADVANKMIFTTQDNGNNIQKVKLAFHPTDITFHEEEPLTFLAYDKLDPDRKLWLTKDYGQSWTTVQEFVKSFFWSTRGDDGDAADQSVQLYVEREEPGGTSTVLASGTLFQGEREHSVLVAGVEDFQVKGEFMFATKKNGETDLDLLVAYRRGPFVKAVFQSELDRRDYHVASIEGSQVLVAVGHTDELANLYVSETADEHTVKFALSLERIFCFFPNATWKDTWINGLSEESFADLHKVEGMKGIYIASQVSINATSSNIHPDYLTTVISFDRGGEWKPIQPPMFDDEGQKINCNMDHGCSLHLSMKFNTLYPATRSVPILSSKSTPGIILATGVVGHSLKGHPGIFMSRDAGLSWRQVLKDNYFYNFGDHGGLLVAVRYFRNRGETRVLLYSTDEGETWQRHAFFDDDLKIYGLMTEPGENTTMFTMFGSNVGLHLWLIVKVDLRNAFSYNCSADDYKFWSPRTETDSRMPCLLGRKETFARRNPHSNCYNGKDYDRPVKMEICDCDAEDYECEYGFVRGMGVKNCIRNKSNKEDPYAVPATCTPGGFYNRTKGYRRIPEDVCVGGYEDRFLPDVLPCPFSEKNEFLLVAQREKIARFDLVDKKMEELPIAGLKNVIAIEFDLRNNCVYWADIVNDTIARQCLSDGKGKREILVSTNLSSIEGMALDWVSNVLYFVDGLRASIEVIRTDLSSHGRMRRTILGSGVLKKPRGIVVHPMKGYIFWTDWAPGDASVSRANSDGSDVRRLFKKPLVEWPNGITIDHIAERIYWVDAREDYIGASDLDGNKFKKIIANDERVSHPFAVAVFKDNMYWDDWKQNAIFVADKDHGVSIQTVAGQLQMLMDLKVFAHSVQEGSNACKNISNISCSHLCLGMPRGGHVCLCPDGMTKKDDLCMCPDNVPAFANGTCKQVANSCSPDQFKCGNGLCVMGQWHCDGDNDCGDFSDERDCRTSTCPANLFQCGDGKCIPPYWRCDLDRDCADGADEAHCNYTTCTNEQFQCANGRCISARWRCDLEDDCRDGSDEVNCTANGNVPLTCKPEEFRCTANSQCLPSSWRCDGEQDCTDNSDELGCPANACNAHQFQCANNHCIYASWRCDGEDDCKDGNATDEANCTGAARPTDFPPIQPPFLPTNTCNDWMFLCGNKKCIPYWWKCDGTSDCEDDSDEVGCPPTDAHGGTVAPGPPTTTRGSPPLTCSAHEFKCSTGECIADAWVCDGEPDCPGREDEAHCKGAVRCTSEQFTCRVDGSCISLGQLCDGRAHCPDGTDEEGCEHRTPQPAPAEPSCSAGTFLCDETRCLPRGLYCDGREDCYDGSDEASCDPNAPRVYQALTMSVDPRTVSPASLVLSWSMKTAPQPLPFLYLPSYAPAAAAGPGAPAKWTNHTRWIADTEFKFDGLEAYTRYNLTVYVKAKDVVYPPGKYVVAMTGEGVPSPPWNVTVKQVDPFHVEVRWQAPARPNGAILGYSVLYTPPLPPVQTNLPRTNTYATIWVAMNATFQNYTFWVVAKNSVANSNSSRVATLTVDNATLVEPVQGLVVERSTNSTVTLSWKAVAGAEGYRVSTKASVPYPAFPLVNTTQNRITITGLSPGLGYLVAVSSYKRDYPSAPSTVTAQTSGEPLPLVARLAGDVLKLHGTTVKLHWDAPKDARKVKWQYGVYYANNIKDLFTTPNLVTGDTNATITQLAACESYVFDVGVVGPLGVGPLASPQAITTQFNASAPPKNVRVTPDPQNEETMVVTWNSSCQAMKEKIKYMVTVYELTLNKTSSMTMYPSSQTGLSLPIRAHLGGHYSVWVKTAADNAIPSAPVEYHAPPILPPHQVVVRSEPNGSYVVYWQERRLPDSLAGTPYAYKVLVAAGGNLTAGGGSTTEYDAAAPPFLLDGPREAAQSYSFAVVLVTGDGYRSMMSEVCTVEMVGGSWSAVLSTSNVVSIVVPIVLILAALTGAALLFFVRGRRLQRSFTSFANSHYDTRSGAATFSGGNELVGDFEDEEDSPVIRGFSDDEPLVIA